MIDIPGEEIVICDGEVSGNRVLNRLVGLFKVERLRKDDLQNGRAEFIPDKFFFNARECSDFLKIMKSDFLRSIKKIRPDSTVEEYLATENKYNLCPVTRRIIQRYTSSQGPSLHGRRPFTNPPTAPSKGGVSTDLNKKATGPDIFISFSSEDESLARRVYETFCQSRGRNEVFFSS